MPEDKDKPKVKSVRTRPANVIRAIVLGAAAAAAPAALSTGCVGETDYGAPLPDATQEDAGDGEVIPADTAYGVPDGSDDVIEVTPPYGVPDGVDYGVPDGTEPDAVEYYGVPDGGGEATPAYATPDGTEPDAVEYYGVPEYGVPPDGGEPEYGTDYGVPKPPAK